MEHKSEKGKVLPLSVDFHALLSCKEAGEIGLLERLQVDFGRGLVADEEHEQREAEQTKVLTPTFATVSLTAPSRTGVAVLSVKHRGQQLAGSPFPIRLVPSRISLLSSRVFSMPKGVLVWSAGHALYQGNVKAKAGSRVSFTVCLSDANGNTVTTKQKVYAYLLSEIDASFRKDATCKQLGDFHVVTAEVALAGLATLCIEVEGVEVRWRGWGGVGGRQRQREREREREEERKRERDTQRELMRGRQTERERK